MVRKLLVADGKMKRHVAFTTLTLVTLTVLAAAQTPDARWYTSKPEADTFYIRTADELAGLTRIVNDVDNGYDFRGKTVVLVNDIDLSEWGEWIPIGGYYNPFNGVFNGGGRVVKGIYINNNNQSRVGLFGYVAMDGVIKNVGVVDVDILAYLYVGGVVGELVGGVVSGCYTTGVGNVRGTPAGGVVGYVEGGGSVANCYSTIVVRGSSRAGGVVGEIRDGTVTNCYSTSDVGNPPYAVKDRNPVSIGGVVGRIFNGSVVSCYSTGTIKGYGSVGGVVGSIWGDSRVIGCAALNPTVDARERSGRVAGMSEEEKGLSGNVAFRAINGNFSDVRDANTVNGADITIEEILAIDSTLEKLFTKENGWAIEKGKLPGLLGKTVDIPEHLYNTAVLTENREIPSGGSFGVEAAVIIPTVPTDTSFDKMLVGPNPVDKQFGAMNFFYRGKRIENGTLTVYDASGNFVKKENITDKPAGNAAKRVVASWNLRDKKGRSVSDGTYLIRGTITVVGGKREIVSMVVGVR